MTCDSVKQKGLPVTEVFRVTWQFFFGIKHVVPDNA